MAELRALLTAPDALRVYGALGAAAWAAKQGDRQARAEGVGLAGGQEPTLDQLRADALVGLLCSGGGVSGGRGAGPAGAGVAFRPGGAGPAAASSGREAGGRGAGPAGAGVAVRPGGARAPAANVGSCGPTPRGERPQILVTVPAGTLLGLGAEPAHLAGHGPIPDSLARELAQDATWRRILTDPASGAVLDVGRTRHDPPADLDRHVRARDGMCRFPGCRRQASGCDLDHLVPYPRGETSAANLHALCRRHHRLKHETGWTVTTQPGNRLEWTSPLGAVYTTDPPTPGDEAHTLTGLDHARVALPEPDESVPWEDFEAELHRWLDDPAVTDALARADDPDVAPDWPKCGDWPGCAAPQQAASRT